jgi:O-antigen ligase/Flp pilus assembly protein TadD
VLRTTGSPASTAAFLALALLAVAMPFARGGVDWPIQAAALAVACLAALLAAGSRRGSTPLLVAGLALGVLATAAQLLAVPAALHPLLAPGAASMFRTTLEPLGLYPAARPFSLDPPATGRELATAAACLLAALAAARLAGSERRKELLLAVVALAGIAVSAAGLVAAGAGLGPLLEPRLTFVNPNHLAAFLDLTSLIALGFGLRSRGRTRLLWLIGFALAASGIFLSLSRGGIAAFFVGVAVFALLHLRRERGDTAAPRPWRRAALPVAVATAMAVAAYLALDPVLAEMRTLKGAGSETKLALWPVALGMLRHFPLTGIGRGAFPAVFTSYQTETGAVTFTHVENQWIQAPVDLGLPVGVLLVAVIVWTWLSAARSRGLTRPEMGALAGMAALGAHDVVDFSLELLGVAIPFALALGLVARPLPAWNLRPAAIRAGALALLLLGAAGMKLHLDHRGDAEVATIAQARSTEEAVALARSQARWHPADYLPQAAAGARLARDGRCAEAMPWLGRAMLLNSGAPEPHRFAARCLAAGGKADLARREYRLAVLLGDEGALAEAAARFGSLDDLLAVAPDTPQGLHALAGLLGPRRPADAATVLRRAWEVYGDLAALRDLAAASLGLGKTDEALELARAYRERRRTEPGGYAIAARALLEQGRHEEAQRELELGVAHVPGSPELLSILAERALGARRFAEARRLVEGMTARAPWEIASKRLFVARILWAQGRMTEAIQEARSAAAIVPADPGALAAVATYCAGAGRLEEAIAALEGAASLSGARPGAYDGELTRLRTLRRADVEQRDRDAILGKQGGTPERP